LWAFVLSPEEVSQDILNAAYSIGEYIREHSTMECLECVVPEIKDLSLTWHKVDDKARGQKIGYIIGKYGVEIFAPIGAVKGIIKVKALKRANTVLTLESCAASHKNQSKVLKESSKFAAIRRNILQEAANTGKILVESANKKKHIMQPKHAWDKLVTITGSLEEDCKSVVKLLEDNKIFSLQYRMEEIIEKTYIRYDHVMQINGHKVKAIFNKKPNGEIFLNDAWVITK
jgi:Bacterial toxin 35